MRYVFVSIVIVSLVSGCDGSQQQNSEVNTSKEKIGAHQSDHKKGLQADLKNQEGLKTPALSRLGIEKNGTKIIIDTNKTKQFFESVAHKAVKKVEMIGKEIQESIEINESGVRYKDKKIEIDINHTKQMFKKVHQSLKEIGDSLRNATVELIEEGSEASGP